MKWYEKPVIMILSEKEKPISMIPFPTVTICPQTKLYKNKLDLTNLYGVWMNAPENLSDIEYENKIKFLL